MFNKQQNLLGRTRSETVNVGKRKIPQKVAEGYKLINSALLSEAISNSTICKHCKNPCSKLVLKEKTMMRYGLAEKLSINCSICEKSTEFNTSLKVTSSQKSRDDVNIRSVYAAQIIGGLQRSGLQTFCNIMDLPPPVAKINFNNISKAIAISAKDAAKVVLKEAGERLFDISIDNVPRKY